MAHMADRSGAANLNPCVPICVGGLLLGERAVEPVVSIASHGCVERIVAFAGLVNCVLCGCAMTAELAYVKPFELLADGNESGNWPGGRDSKTERRVLLSW